MRPDPHSTYALAPPVWPKHKLNSLIAAADAMGERLEELSEEFGRLGQGEAARSMAESAVAEFSELVAPVSAALSNLRRHGEEERAMLADYARERLNPFLTRSPFFKRALDKPLGYAGDYRMVLHLLDEPEPTADPFGDAMDAVMRSVPAAEAHRNRVGILESFLHDAADRARAAGRPFKVLNLGCGPAAEVAAFIRSCPHPELLEFELVDFNAETLDYAKGAIARAAAESGKRAEAAFTLAPVAELFKRGSWRQGEAFDAAYCAGLFDYLDDAQCRRVASSAMSKCRPGSAGLFTNVHARNCEDPSGPMIEHLARWPLICRDEHRFASLMPKGARSRIYCDGTGMNVFAELRNPIA